MTDPGTLDDNEFEVSKDHAKLLESIADFDKGRRIKKPERNEPTLEVSEFHLTKRAISDKNAVQIKDLASSLGKKGHHFELSKKLQSTRQKSKLLQKPLEKPAAERIKRTVAFGAAKKDLDKWNPIIAKQRTAETVSFPLKVPVKLGEPKQVVKRFRIQSGLETELNALQPKQEEKVEEKADTYAMTLKEAIIKRQEIAKMRAQQSYREAKAHRQKKIKSKKFHRIQKKVRVKKKMNELEQLQKTDPQAALEVLERMDKARAEERMVLRHKSTGQWARNKQIRAKYDKETRQELAEQLAISRELTQKVRNDSEDENDDSTLQALPQDKENPWVNGQKTEEEIDEFIKSYRAYWDTKGKDTQAKSVAEHTRPVNTVNSPVVNSVEEVHKETVTAERSSIEDVQNTEALPNTAQTSANKSSGTKRKGATVVATDEWSVESLEVPIATVKKKKVAKKAVHTPFRLGVKEKETPTSKEPVKKKSKRTKTKSVVKKSDDVFEGLRPSNDRKRPVIDAPLNETTDLNESDTRTKLITLVNGTLNDAPKNKESEIDPDKYINVKPKRLHTELPDSGALNEDAMDDSASDQEGYNIVSEAFAGDDVVEEFRKEKEEEIKRSQPKDLDLTLPGWGSWGGKSIKVSRRKQKRFVIKFPKVETRRDENKGNVILFEGANNKIREHQVSELPYPFTTVTDFEASMRMPIGRTFVPEKAHRNLTKPKVQTKIGEIIEPMDQQLLVNLEKKIESKSLSKKTMQQIKGRNRTQKQNGRPGK